MEMYIKCRNCNKSRNIDVLKCRLRDLEFCSDACNEEYFLKEGGGLVPKAFLGRYLIMSSTGRAILKTLEVAQNG